MPSRVLLLLSLLVASTSVAQSPLCGTEPTVLACETGRAEVPRFAVCGREKAITVRFGEGEGAQIYPGEGESASGQLGFDSTILEGGVDDRTLVFVGSAVDLRVADVRQGAKRTVSLAIENKAGDAEHLTATCKRQLVGALEPKQLAVLGSLKAAGANEEPEPDVLLALFNGGSAEECLARLALPQVASQPVAVKRALNQAAETCGRTAMTKALDARLLTLKKRQRVQFSKEMSLQKEWNSALKKLCEPYHSKCPSTAAWDGHTRCMLKGHVYREQQARAVLAKELVVPGRAEGAPAVADALKVFDPFAKGLCALPKELFRGKAVMTDCRESIMEELQSTLPVFGAEGAPGC